MSITKQVLQTRMLQHILFWSISLYLLLLNFQASSTLATTDIIYTGIFSVFLIAAVYINISVLIPKLFQNERYLIYLITLLLTISIIVFTQIFLFDNIVEILFPGYYLISYIAYWETLNYFIVFVGVTSLLHFSKSWFLFKESEAVLIETQKKKTEAELVALKNQINPHFLFNSLNSIYSLVLKKSDNAPEALIKLSDTMRFIIYESNNERVELSKEIDFVKSYIELQKLRMSAKDILTFKVSGNYDQQKIAPLLLIPIIENCFKYGIKGEVESSFVIIKILLKESTLSLHTKNNIGHIDNIEKQKSKGTGLLNLKQRLELIYPEKYQLDINENFDNFSVNLTIEL